MHIQLLIKNIDCIENIKVKAMSKDYQNHCYFMFVIIQVKENLLCIHTNNWLLKALPKTHI